MQLFVLIAVGFAVMLWFAGPLEQSALVPQLSRAPFFTRTPLLARTPHEASKQPALNVFYLKIHKCSSSTMQMLFERYAVWNNLKTVVFAGAAHTFPDPSLSPFVISDWADVREYNILSSHIVFSENQIRQLLPKNTTFLTILREPFSLLKSEFKYYKLCKKFRLANCTLSEFLSRPEVYDIRASKSYVKTKRASYTRNFMARHLGFDDFSPPAFNLSHWIEYIDERFHFIGLVERMPETLVYMRRLLNWTTKDVLYLSLRNTTLKTSTAQDVDIDVTKIDELKNAYRKWSPVDHELYDYFSRRFDEKIQALGDDFQQEVQTYVHAQKTVSAFCSHWCPFLRNCTYGHLISDRLDELRNTTVFIEGTEWNTGFQVSLEDCLMMMMNPDSIRKTRRKRRRQDCNGPMCGRYIANSLPPDGLQYLACMGPYSN